MKISAIPAETKVVCECMQLCVTSNNLIRAGTQPFNAHIKLIGDKNGNFGGVNNDSAFIQLENDNWVILSIFTCLSLCEFKHVVRLLQILRKKFLKEIKSIYLIKKCIHYVYNFA